MSVQVAKRPFTVDEYYRMAESGILTEHDHVELINGEILAMSPIGSHHAGCVKRLNNILSTHLKENAIVSVQDPIYIDQYSEPEPDIAVLKPRSDFYTQHHPVPQDVLLIIEVSDITLKYDREVKLPLYAKAGIPEVWIVNLVEDRIEIYTQPAQDLYKQQRIYKKEDTLTLLDQTFSAGDILG